MVAIVAIVACALTTACGSRLRRAMHATEGVDVEPIRRNLVALDELDLDAWLRTVDARIIAVGEPNHGSRPPRELQVEIVLAAARLFPRLVIFGEWCDDEGRVLDAYIHGHGTSEDPPRIAGPVIWSETWDVAWRALRAAGGSPNVAIFGLRACRPTDHEVRIEALRRELPARACELDHQAALLAQARQRREDPLFQEDRAMAENVSRVLGCLEPEARAIIVAHDGHVAKTERMLLPNGRRQDVVFLGTALAAEFPGDYYAVASLAGDGRFCAVPQLRPRSRTTRAFRLTHPRGALERHLARAPSLPPGWFLDLRAVPRGTFPTPSFIAGHGYSWGWPFSWVPALGYRETDLQHDFDAVVYWRSTEPDALPGCE
jgi:erythromycin esterase-like protein